MRQDWLIDWREDTKRKTNMKYWKKILKNINKKSLILDIRKKKNWLGKLKIIKGDKILEKTLNIKDYIKLYWVIRKLI